MKGEIGKDFYCSASAFAEASDGSTICFYENKPCRQDRGCLNYHRKHPTPEQYREEYGEEVPDDMPVWYIDSDDPRDVWSPDLYANAVDDERYIIVVACTPFPQPDNDWRPV